MEELLPDLEVSRSGVMYGGGVHLYGRKPEEPIIEAPPDGQPIVYVPHGATVVSHDMDGGLEIRALFKP